MKYIKKMSSVPLDPINGSVVDTFNVTDKTRNAPSINLIQGKILWQNPNPNSSQAGWQNITLSSNDYDVLEWYFQPKVNENQLTCVRTLKGWKPCMSVGYCGTSGVVYRDRNANRIDDVTFQLEDGRTATGASARTTDNNCCVLTYIVGYKIGI